MNATFPFFLVGRGGGTHEAMRKGNLKDLKTGCSWYGLLIVDVMGPGLLEHSQDSVARNLDMFIVGA